ncbi:hypothetical protein LZ30DRAFT_729559 [Colletotrichum cereale]|nr:hypothetical protein LZ30DRAFT_729559 [Colletotrichum cereale]
MEPSPSSEHSTSSSKGRLRARRLRLDWAGWLVVGGGLYPFFFRCSFSHRPVAHVSRSMETAVCFSSFSPLAARFAQMETETRKTETKTPFCLCVWPFRSRSRQMDRRPAHVSSRLGLSTPSKPPWVLRTVDDFVLPASPAGSGSPCPVTKIQAGRETAGSTRIVPPFTAIPVNGGSRARATGISRNGRYALDTCTYTPYVSSTGLYVLGIYHGVGKPSSVLGILQSISALRTMYALSMISSPTSAQSPRPCLLSN